MKSFATTILVAVVVCWAVEAHAQAAAISVAIPPSARANAMGQAYVALADDATATWWNPAGLGFLKRRDASVTHAQLVPDLADDVFHEFLAYAQPVENWGTFAASLVYLSYGTSQGRDNFGTDLGEFRSYEFAPAISYGTSFGEQVGFGVSFKYIRVQLSPDFPNLPPGAGSGSTVAADVGALWKVPGNRVNLGAALQNLGPNITFIQDERSDPIYRNFKGGFAATAYNQNKVSFLVLGEINQLLVRGEIRDETTGETRRRYGKPIWNGGGELGYTTADLMVALRGGYMHDEDGSISDPTYGLGIGYKGIRLDFASIPQAEDKESGTKLDRVSKFSLGARF